MTEQEKQLMSKIFSELGKKGGQTTKERNPDQFKEMNKKSLEARRRNKLRKMQEKLSTE